MFLSYLAIQRQLFSFAKPPHCIIFACYCIFVVHTKVHLFENTILYSFLRCYFPVAASAFSVMYNVCSDRLCGLVVRVPDYRSRGPGIDFLRSSGPGTGSTQLREYN
jgi:hypothetical protein